MNLLCRNFVHPLSRDFGLVFARAALDRFQNRIRLGRDLSAKVDQWDRHLGHRAFFAGLAPLGFLNARICGMYAVANSWRQNVRPHAHGLGDDANGCSGFCDRPAEHLDSFLFIHGRYCKPIYIHGCKLFCFFFFTFTP